MANNFLLNDYNACKELIPTTIESSLTTFGIHKTASEIIGATVEHGINMYDAGFNLGKQFEAGLDYASSFASSMPNQKMANCIGTSVSLGLTINSLVNSTSKMPLLRAIDLSVKTFLFTKSFLETLEKCNLSKEFNNAIYLEQQPFFSNKFTSSISQNIYLDGIIFPFTASNQATNTPSKLFRPGAPSARNEKENFHINYGHLPKKTEPINSKISTTDQSSKKAIEKSKGIKRPGALPEKIIPPNTHIPINKDHKKGDDLFRHQPTQKPFDIHFKPKPIAQKQIDEVIDRKPSSNNDSHNPRQK